MSPLEQQCIKWLALGDSYTCAEGIEPAAGWPNQLYQQLRSSDIDVNRPEIIAQNGWTCFELSVAIHQAGLEQSYDLVTIMIGANNHYRGMGTDEFTDELRDLYCNLVSPVCRRTSSSVLWITIPDWGVSPFGRNHERTDVTETINMFNQQILNVATEMSCRAIDITELSRHIARDNTMFAPDGLHPSVHQYGCWVDRIYPEVLKICKDTSADDSV